MALFGSVMRSSLVRNSLAMVRLETLATNSVKLIFVQARNAAQKLEGAGLGHLKKINCRFDCTNADNTICDIDIFKLKVEMKIIFRRPGRYLLGGGVISASVTKEGIRAEEVEITTVQMNC